MIRRDDHPGGIRLLYLDRPERRNAMVPEMMDALTSSIRTADQDSQVRALVLTGSGTAFCVGADLKWLAGQEDPADGIARLVASHHAAVRALQEAGVPVVAAVNGPAAGGGMSLALAADYRLASMGASFTAAYFRLGLTPDGGNSTFLVRAVGAARAMELLVTNRTLRAVEAHSWGLVSTVVPSGRLQADSLAAARSMADLRVPRETLLATRALLDAAPARGLEEQLAAEEAAMVEAARRPAFPQGLQAFLARRP